MHEWMYSIGVWGKRVCPWVGVLKGGVSAWGRPCHAVHMLGGVLWGGVGRGNRRGSGDGVCRTRPGEAATDSSQCSGGWGSDGLQMALALRLLAFPLAPPKPTPKTTTHQPTHPRILRTGGAAELGLPFLLLPLQLRLDRVHGAAWRRCCCGSGRGCGCCCLGGASGREGDGVVSRRWERLGGDAPDRAGRTARVRRQRGPVPFPPPSDAVDRSAVGRSVGGCHTLLEIHAHKSHITNHKGVPPSPESDEADDESEHSMTATHDARTNELVDRPPAARSISFAMCTHTTTTAVDLSHARSHHVSQSTGGSLPRSVDRLVCGGWVAG